VSEDQGSLQTKSQRLAIAAAIQHHLDAHGLARKDLIRDYLSKSTIDKLFQGEFSERTLTKIEAILNIALTPRHAEDDQAPSQIGGYTLQAATICRAIICACARCSPTRQTLTPI
jgi:hypothetical protein